MTSSDRSTSTRLELSADEALVLFEVLARYSHDRGFVDEHPAEERALWNLLALLESDLTAPLDARYAELLAAARERLLSQQIEAR